MIPTHTLSPSRLVDGLPLDGVRLHHFEVRTDNRGCFTEVFQESWALGVSPVQWSIVESAANVLRGMHLHRRHSEYFALLRGRASVGLRDLRPCSPTYNRWALYQLSSDRPACLVFPAGVLHGWYFPKPSLHLQAVSESHAEYQHDDNLGCHWSDPALEIPWPCTDPILAERAAAFPRLRDLLRTLSG